MPPRALDQRISKGDRIVVVMGLTGAGKSTFIEHATGQNRETVSHGWSATKAEIRSVRVSHPDDGHPVVFVDTPGFDHTFQSDIETRFMISEWLTKAKGKNATFAAIVYVHRISDNRISGSALSNLRSLADMCGKDAMKNVAISTTMWSKVSEEDGMRMEAALKRDVWNEMIVDGCTAVRFEDTCESAWSIVRDMMQKNMGAKTWPDPGNSRVKPEVVSTKLIKKLRRSFSNLVLRRQ